MTKADKILLNIDAGQEIAIIIGAGPAGLKAAYELLNRTNIKPIVIEKSAYMGGISRTVNYKGNRIDIGGHRFFSKSDKVMEWWLNMLPLQEILENEKLITYHQNSRKLSGAIRGKNPEQEDCVMLLRSRRSRIYFGGKFYEYPLSLNQDTLYKMGFIKTLKIIMSYLKSVYFPIKKEENLEQFFINRFGTNLYLTFFKSYTEKVWGVPCHQISAEWGKQRIKGLSVGKAISHFVKQLFRTETNVLQKEIETSLIENFLYPKYGPGQMWEKVAHEIKAKGGEIIINFEVDKIYLDGNCLKSLEAVNTENGEKRNFEGKYFFSTMSIKELVRATQIEVPEHIFEISEGLVYRDFITVGLLLNKLKIKNDENNKELIKDSWIYVQDPNVMVGRIQIFNNWSSYLVADPTKVWIGLEYFCYQTDEIWKKSDRQIIQFGIEELVQIGFIEKTDVLDATVIRMPKAYPAYFGSYDRFEELKDYLNQLENLYLIGRNGMHKYNNQDHSMLTAMTAVDNIVNNIASKNNIWAINIEDEYHEKK